MMPDIDGVSALKQIQESPFDVKTIVLTESDDEGMQILAMKLGASGYLVKTTGLEIIAPEPRPEWNWSRRPNFGAKIYY